MASQLSSKSDFTETFAMHIALKAALKAKMYKSNEPVRRAAEKLCAELEGERSIYGRQLKMLTQMEKGVTLVGLSRKLRCSRRTVFRYLNHLENAGIALKLKDNNMYFVDKGIARLLRV